jgi:tetratricopeptide (TPR) repeat protein
LEQNDEALEALGNAVELAGGQVDLVTRYTLGVTCAAAERYEESLKQYEAIEQRIPRSAPVHVAFGAVYRARLAQIGEISTARDEYRVALERFTRALAIDPELAQAYREIGRLLELSGDLPAALERHLRAIDLQPGTSTFRCSAATLLVKMGRPDEAQRLVQEGLRILESNPAPLQNQMGIIWEAKSIHRGGNGISKELEQALAAFEQAIELAPWNGVYHFHAGRVCVKLKRTDLAQTYLQEAIRLKPRMVAWRHQLALLFEQEDLREQAIEEYRHALQAVPEDVDSLVGLGRNLVEIGNLEEAADCVQRALKAEPSAAAYDQFAVIRRLQGQPREALRLSQQALRREPGNHSFQLNLALTQKALGQAEKAAAEISRIAVEAPNLSSARYHSGAYLEEAGTVAEACEEYLQAMTLAPKSLLYARAAARAYRLLGQYDQAQKILDEISRTAPHNIETLVEIARLELARGNWGSALRSYRRVIAAQDKPEYRAELATAFRQKGMLDEAFAEIRAALATESRNPRWQSELGLIREEQGSLEEAVKLYREALRLDSNVAEFHRNLGVALKKQGKFEEAIAELQRALDLKPDYVDAYRHLTAASASQLLRKTLRNNG